MNMVKLSVIRILLPITMITLTACAEKETYNSQTTSPTDAVLNQGATINKSANTKLDRLDSKIDAEVFDYEAEKFIKAKKD